MAANSVFEMKRFFSTTRRPLRIDPLPRSKPLRYATPRTVHFT